MSEINPRTNQEYYAGSVDDVKKFCKSLNIDSGRLAAIQPVNVLPYMSQAEEIIDGYLEDHYFVPVKFYNQVDASGVPHLVFPGRIRYLAQQLTAGLLMISEYQHQEQNMNEMGTKMIEEAKKEIYQMTLWNHRIPGQRRKASRISHTLPPNFAPGRDLVEQLWSMN